MPTTEAIRRCPELIIISSRHHDYQAYSNQVLDLVRDSAPLVEQISIDEAFLDVSDAREAGAEIAQSLQRQIRERFGLPTSWGVATNKLVAKIATEVGKPEGLMVVPPGEEAVFLARLPVEMLWGVGPKTKARLVEVGVETIGALAAMPDERLMAVFGERGLDLAARARGEDDRPVKESHRRKSISSERTFPKDISDEGFLRQTILSMSEELGRRLRKKELAGMTVRIKLRWPTFDTITRQTRLDQPTDQDDEIFEAAYALFRKTWKRGRKVRLMGVGVADLGPRVRQLDFFDDSWQSEEKLLDALDSIRDRFGRNAVRRASALKSRKKRAP
jgi:DNA polymerase-4